MKNDLTAENVGETGEDGRRPRRETRFTPDGAYFFADELRVEGELTARIVTCRAWLLEIWELAAGEVFFLRDAEKIQPRGKVFGVFYAPFSVIEAGFKNARGRFVGLAAVDPPAGAGKSPLIFETSPVEGLSGAEKISEILRAAENPRSIEINSRPSLVSLSAKRLIDENYLIYPSISKIAARLKVSPEHLARRFKNDFQMTPSAYLRLLRIADAPLRLARGEEIVSVSHEVGYNDLSRFYKQFRQTTKTSPGVCQTLMKPQTRRSKNAKTKRVR